MITASYLGKPFDNSAAIGGAELAGIMGFHPSKVDGENVIVILRIGKFQPLPREVRWQFSACPNRCGRGRGGGKAKIYWCVTEALHT